MPEIIYIIADPHSPGDLSSLSRSSHMWIWLTEHNKALYRDAVARDSRSYSPHYGLSGYQERGNATESLYFYLGVVDDHHNDLASNPPWDEIRVVGLTTAQLDVARIRQELGVEAVQVQDEDGMVIIRRSH